MEYIPVIGLEIHVELKTSSKMFCQCQAEYFGREPNTQVCPVCFGMPGALPVPNKKAIEYCQLIGKALNCKIAKESKFDRKHYFYPDLPKGYQISQYDEPFATNGWLEIKDKRFGITRVHMEEDTGKLMHVEDDTLVDFNRSGVPLVEIVTEPDFDNSEEVKKFLEELQTIIRYLDVSDADMEKGTMRLEPNISLRKLPITNNQLPKYKVEVKNINSFNFVKRAVDYEIERQRILLDKGITPEQETRGFNENKGVTFSQRTKEEAQDYRYFPEPDIPPMKFEQKFIDGIKIPELPSQKVARYVSELGIKEADAITLTRNRKTTDYFEQVNSKFKVQSSKLQLKIQNASQTLANYIINKKLRIDISPEEFVKKAISMFQPAVVDETLLKETVKKVIENNSNAVEDYKKGKETAIMFLVGQVIKELNGQADAQRVKSEIEKKLKS